MSNSTNLNTVPQSVLAQENPLVTKIESETPKEMPKEAVSSVPSKPKIDSESESVVSARFAHLSKQQAALVKAQETLKKERESWEKQRSESQAETDRLKKAYEMVKEIEELQKTNSVEAMRKAGFSETDAYNFLAQYENTTSPEEKATKLVQQELSKFKADQQKERELAKQELENVKKEAENKSIATFKKDISKFITEDKDKYEYCNFNGQEAEDLIYETAYKIIEESDVEETDLQSFLQEASDLVEEYFEEKDKSMSSLKKRQPKPTETPKEEEKQEVISEEPISILEQIRKTNRIESKQYINNKIPSKTLSNKMGVSSSSTANPNMTPEQNKQSIINKYLTMLKK